MKAKNPVVWFEIYVDDMPRAKAFYESVLNQELTRLDKPDEQKDFPQPEMPDMQTSFPLGICRYKGSNSSFEP